MSILIADKQPATDEAVSAEHSAPRLFKPGGVTLEDVVLGAWEALVAEGRAECPACGAGMAMLRGCERCGSELS